MSTGTWEVWGDTGHHFEDVVELGVTRERAVELVDTLRAQGHAGAYAVDRQTDETYSGPSTTVTVAGDDTNTADVVVPEDASAAFNEARATALAGPTASLADYEGLLAAAPLILAAGYEQTAKDVERWPSATLADFAGSGKAYQAYHDGKRFVIEQLRRRASVLRGVGRPS